MAQQHDPSGFVSARHGQHGHRPRSGTGGRRRPAPDRSRWHWLLWLPILLPLFPVVYNRSSPELNGLPFYYWGQLAFALLAAAVITIVHVATRSR